MLRKGRLRLRKELEQLTAERCQAAWKLCAGGCFHLAVRPSGHAVPNRFHLFSQVAGAIGIKIDRPWRGLFAKGT
jgi:hypothetical protein